MFNNLFFSLLTIGLAEFGDKSQLSIMLLSSKAKKRLYLLLGVMLGFLIVDGLAVLMGSFVTTVIPEKTLKIIAGLIFLAFGIIILRSKSETEGAVFLKHNSFIAGFMLIFFSEWGDKTQLLTALFATKFNPLLVFLGVMLVLSMLSTATVIVGKFLFQKINRVLLTRIAGFLFIAMGVLSFL